jgi:hypothetical protein
LIGQFSLTGQVQPLITQLLKKRFHACVDGFLRRLFAVSCSLPIFFRTRKHVSLRRQLKFCAHTAVVYFFYAIGPWSNTAPWAQMLGVFCWRNAECCRIQIAVLRADEVIE